MKLKLLILLLLAVALPVFGTLQAAQTEADSSLTQAMAEAIDAKSLSDMRAALDAGADINGRDDKDFSFAERCVLRNFKEGILLLRERGVDLETAGTNGTSLLWTAAIGFENQIVSLETVQTLLQLGASPDATTEEFDNETLLMLAIFKTNAPLARLLLEYGADPTRPRKDGYTALDIAAQSESTHIRSYFIAYYQTCVWPTLKMPSFVGYTLGTPLTEAQLKVRDDSIDPTVKRMLTEEMLATTYALADAPIAPEDALAGLTSVSVTGYSSDKRVTGFIARGPCPSDEAVRTERCATLKAALESTYGVQFKEVQDAEDDIRFTAIQGPVRFSIGTSDWNETIFVKLELMGRTLLAKGGHLGPQTQFQQQMNAPADPFSHLKMFQGEDLGGYPKLR